MLLVGLYQGYKTKTFIDSAKRTTGTVVAHVQEDDVYYTVVDYMNESGKEFRFKSTLGTMYKKFSVGDTLQVLYSPHDPTDARVDNLINLWFLPIVFVLIGIIPTLVGLVWSYLRIKKSRQDKLLKESGKRIRTDFKEVIVNRSVSVNNKCPYQIVSEYKAQGNTYTFYSENLWEDPSEYISEDTPIYVLVDGNDYTKYYVEIDKITGLKK
jgi:archaellum component FlaG (FlaF/FlaG flagellin family)